jgi:hypothetical protein
VTGRLKLVFPGQLTDEELSDWLRGNGYARIADLLEDEARDEQRYGEGSGCWRYAQADQVWRAAGRHGETLAMTDDPDVAAAYVVAGAAVYGGEVEWDQKPMGGQS